jgi:hypothetical protein
MSGMTRTSEGLDLVKLILLGISALRDPQQMSSYIHNSEFADISKENKITHKYFKFKSLSPTVVAILPPSFIAYDLLNEQLDMYFSRFIAANLDEINRAAAKKTMQEFINICLDPCTRSNLDRLVTLVKTIDNICLENHRKRVEFKKFLDRGVLLKLLELQKFNNFARLLGVTQRAWSTNHYIVLDSMLQQMLVTVDNGKVVVSDNIRDYVYNLEKFLLMPIGESLKPMVDPRGKKSDEYVFCNAFYKLISSRMQLDAEQEFFMLPLSKKGVSRKSVRYKV